MLKAVSSPIGGVVGRGHVVSATRRHPRHPTRPCPRPPLPAHRRSQRRLSPGPDRQADAHPHRDAQQNHRSARAADEQTKNNSSRDREQELKVDAVEIPAQQLCCGNHDRGRHTPPDPRAPTYRVILASCPPEESFVPSGHLMAHIRRNCLVSGARMGHPHSVDPWRKCGFPARNHISARSSAG